MKLRYFDPVFYIASDEMPFVIRVKVNMTDDIDRSALERAVSTVIKRFPYFTVRVVRDGEEYLTEYNPAPVKVFEGEIAAPLGSEALNRHFLAVGFSGKRIDFYVSHVITDGCGFYPFMNSVLYYYVSYKTGTFPAPMGAYLADSDFFPDEIGNPYPEALMENAEPLYVKGHVDSLKLEDGGYISDKIGTVYHFRVSEKEMINFSFDHDGSPNALMSVLMAKAIRELHPDDKRSITSAVSFNMRQCLGNRHNYRMLCSSLLLEYTYRMKDDPILRLCTCSRGMITLQSQPENAIYTAAQTKKLIEYVGTLPTLEERKRVISEKAIYDCHDNTFSVSYVGRVDFGSSTPYIDSIYNVTDGSTHGSIFIEITALNGYFNIAMIQGFSTDVYYKALLKQFEACGISYTEGEVTPFGLPGVELP